MKTSKLFQNILILSLALTLGYCTSDSSKSKTKKPFLDELNMESNLEELNYFRFPSPEEIFSFVQASDVDFIPGIVNNFEDHKNYIDSKKQTLNLGIYMSDLAYFTVFKKQDETYNYLNTVHKLCNAIKIESAFSSDFLKRVHENLFTIDSLINLSGDGYRSIVTYLEENRKENTLALLSVGTYIESMYLTLHFIDDYKKNPDMVQKIADQKYAFENLYLYTSQHLDQENDKEFINMINDIKNVFENVEELEIENTETKETEDGKLVFGGGVKLKMSEETFNKLKETVNTNRDLIIK